MIINEYDIVALTEDTPGTHPETQQSILLRRGQVGTVLMMFNNEACLIDFADSEGQTYAMETVPLEKLMLLFYEPVMTAA
ncbi:MAG: DUF4926 domain-containing protein [Leptolyngbya sp. SIO4C5]|nr:DUF4926 domain-containing protein [Leptolyngbya sp. SIO4C5]